MTIICAVSVSLLLAVACGVEQGSEPEQAPGEIPKWLVEICNVADRYFASDDRAERNQLGRRIVDRWPEVAKGIRIDGTPIGIIPSAVRRSAFLWATFHVSIRRGHEFADKCGKDKGS